MSPHAALLLNAAKIALPTSSDDKRLFILGAIGRRQDGTIVKSKNGACRISTHILDILIPRVRIMPKEGFAENSGSMLQFMYLAFQKENNELKMARPCSSCQAILRSYRVKKAYYSINSTHFGCFYPAEDRDQIFHF